MTDISVFHNELKNS